jgi:hypothetical protein
METYMYDVFCLKKIPRSNFAMCMSIHVNEMVEQTYCIRIYSKLVYV